MNHLVSRHSLKIIINLMVIGASIFLCWRFGGEIVNLLIKIDWKIACIITLLHIPLIAGGGLAFDFLTMSFGITLRWQHWVGLSFIANLLNQLLPYRPGMAFRYCYLRNHYQLNAVQYIQIMLIYLLLMLFTSILGGIIGWSASKMSVQLLNLHWEAVIGGLIVCLIIGGLIYKVAHLGINPSATVLEKILGSFKFKEMSTALHMIFDQPLLLLKTFMVFIFSHLLNTFIFNLIFIALHHPLPISECLFIVSIFTLATVFPITPGNIGLAEGLLGSLTAFIYHDFSLGVSATALYRACLLIPSLILGTSFSLALMGAIIPQEKDLKIGSSQRVD